MKAHTTEYKKKVISIEEAIQKVETDMVVVVGQVSVPDGLMDHLHTIAHRVRNVKVFFTITVKPYEFFMNPAMKGRFELCSYFHGPATRAALEYKSGNIFYQPNMLHAIAPDHVRTRKTNIFFGSCSPPDKHGFVSLGLSVVYEKSMIENADLVILEVSENNPRIFGDTEVHIDDVDYFVENNHMPPIIPDAPPPEAADLSIGRHIAELIDDGSTIQLGIGNIPNAVGKCLTGKRDLGIHTEMLTDSMMELYECGAVTNKKKSLIKGKTVCAFAFGTKKLYEWADNNVSVLFLRGDWVNDPTVVRRNAKMVSINTCMMVDLTGQVFSEAIGTAQFSGTGGQLDFAMGAREAYDRMGKSFIACRSTAKGGTKSSIIAIPPPGTPVTLHRGITDYVVTEYGAAWLRGKTVKERAQSLIAIAHPDFRDSLKEEAERIGFL
ncbi:MAG: acetyl-CoA hydrolase/transferase C-terminal domain-containing protein [Pseudomonadota bacterium]